MGYWQYDPYVTVAEKKAKAARKREKLMKKNPDLKPVLLEGSAIAKTWWGKSWNKNLERYADYSNRIGRGRSYVRQGAVLDLQITEGEVKTLVQGRSSTPYSIVISIKSINTKAWKKIKAGCEGKLESLQDLLMGEFPKALGELFMEKGAGLFPSPKEIEFSCSCPDWASMCKHVAASLYGVGARLDEEPSLFFKLRKAEIGALVTQAVEDKTKKLLKKAQKKSARVLDDSGLSELFGIDMEEGIEPKREKAGAKTKSKAKVKAGAKTKSKAKAKAKTKSKVEDKAKAKDIMKTKAGVKPRKKMKVKVKTKAKPLMKKTAKKTMDKKRRKKVTTQA